MALDRIVERHGFGPWRPRFKGLLAEGRIGDSRILALKPMTYMNASGQSVQAALGFFKLEPQAITVFHDELDLIPGKVRVKQGGGAAGHNGLRSIDQMLGSPDYRRVRLGIGHPGHKDRVFGYVLGDFPAADRSWLVPFLDAVADRAPKLAEKPAGRVHVRRHRRHAEGIVMGFNRGIVGLPNVGKSTLFNALTATIAAQAANYPFCTIEPNVGRVAVPDKRLGALAAIGKSAKIIPTSLEFVDIAGLVRGASKGEGLGNQFLANIRETDAIIHVLRCFEDSDITHVEGSIDPVRDAEVVETELMLADLESLEKRLIGAAEARARWRQGEYGAAGAGRADHRRLDRGPGSPHRDPRGGTPQRRTVAAADGQARPLRLQRGGGFGCNRQRFFGQGRRDGGAAGCGACRGVGGDRVRG